ncbi:MAG: DUF1444 family protein [Planctomycetota bacterium]|jgi:uncharacterized protein YtpQ (UPF0354 family)
MVLFGCSKKEDSNQNLSWQEQISAENLTEDQFTNLYQQALLEKLPQARIETTGNLELNVHLEDNKFICWLGNAWYECHDTPNMRADTCKYYIDSFLSTANNTRDPKDNIDPNSIILDIKCKEYLDGIPLQEDGTHPIYSKQIAGDIYLTYALRLDHEICFLSEEDLEQIELTNDVLYKTALSNLKRLATEIRVHGKAPFFIITSDGVSASSVFYFDSIWERQKANMSGDIIVCIPSKDFLLFTDSESQEGITEIRNKAKEILKIDTYLISDTLLIRKDGQWQVYEE